MATAQSSSGGVVICHIYPQDNIMLCLHVMARNMAGDTTNKYTQSDAEGKKALSRHCSIYWNGLTGEKLDRE